jgi:hypothetical protein
MSLPNSPPDLAREWYVLLHGERLGPYTLAALWDVLATHPEGWAASVWRPGMLDWRPAQRVPALTQRTESAANVAPPLPAVSATSSRAEAPASTSGPRADASEVRSHADPHASTFRARADPHASTSTSGPQAEARASTRPSAQTHGVATRTRTAPLMAATTHDLPAYSPPATPRAKLPYLLLAAGFVALSALLFALLSPRAAPRAATSSSRAESTATSPSAAATEAREAIAPLPAAPSAAANTASAPAERVASTTSAPPAPSPRVQTESHARQPEAGQKHVRVRARWAPVRAAAAPDAEVLCSLPRGTELSTFGERPGTRARWFSVRCDNQTLGWLHENFLTFVRP